VAASALLGELSPHDNISTMPVDIPAKSEIIEGAIRIEISLRDRCQGYQGKAPSKVPQSKAGLRSSCGAVSIGVICGVAAVAYLDVVAVEKLSFA
jgi:hypothetical protein